ncbi:pyridoxamine 5'-phosphate oxidase family protein [Bernardetia sp.]|uniref:pyridoxamine 5'-phosphate oxidase family protein n=1 Tax=Bernardetia sp. TaxID=1937974 RepID=UPI0025C5438D|nr:pyridoxamine 5'-phosphate oxidase family protein [Bernardetia sp.]
MSDTKNIIGKEAISKMQEMVKNQRICMFATHLSETPFSVCPMTAQEVSDEGHILFLSAANSDHNEKILLDPRVQLTFSNVSDNEFLSVYGKATISKNREKIEKIWEPLAKAWFPNGKDDPNLTIIEVFPEDAYYWDTKDGKIISMVKIVASAMTGEKLETGIEGHLTV